MSSFGWYRECKNCKNLVKRECCCSDKICSETECILGNKKEKNKDNNCQSFKRIWWKIWVPK